MKRWRVLAAASVCMIAIAARAAPAPPGDLAGAIDPIFAAYTATTPGCAVGVERAGEALFTKGYGAADLDAGRPITPQSRFYMASVSKQVTAMAALLLVEDGKLRLSDPVRKHIPELPAYADGVTVAQLLNHTSGIRDYFTVGALSGFGDDHVYTEAGVLELLKRQQALNFAPGSEFLYSNSGYVLVSIIVQRVSGQRLDDFASKRIFIPLGMTASRFQHDHTAAVPDKANGHQRRGDQWRVANSNLDVVGDGGLYSSVDDMLRWLANLDRPVVGAKALGVMRTSARLNDGSPSGYGMGLETTVFRGLEVVQHGGSLVGYQTADWWIPKERLGVVVLCNRGDVLGGALASRVASVVLAGEMKPATAPAQAIQASGEDVARYAGLYRDATGGYAEFGADRGKLYLMRPPTALAPLSTAGLFVPAGRPDGMRYAFAAGGGLDLILEGQPTHHLQRVERRELTGDAGADYVGDYASTEASLPIHIRQSDRLNVSLADRPGAVLVATGPDRLWNPAGGTELTFLRDAAGKVTGFTLNAGRARGMRYAKTAP
jgi:CubicO group peptidase (beta-lactamase class C family)